MKLSRPLNIVLLTTVRFNNSKGGTEKAMIGFANAMADRGHTISIVFRDVNGSTPGYPLNDSVKLCNCANVKTPLLLSGLFRTIRSVSLNRCTFHKKNAYLKLKALSTRFSPILKSIPADIYVTYEPKLSCMLVHELGVTKPIITTLHFAPSYIEKRIDSKWLLPLLSNKSIIQVLTDEYVPEIKKIIPNSRIVSIPNPVEINRECSDLNTPLIINVGTLTTRKHQDLLISAFALLHKEFPSWKIELWGESGLRTSNEKLLNHLIQKNNLSNVVSICGTTNNVSSKLSSASIFAFPSTQEGFPLALLEAMSAGLACIGLVSCPGVDGLIVNEQNGLLSKDNPEDFAACLKRLMIDYELRKKLSKNARATVLKFSPQTVYDMWKDLLYSSISSNNQYKIEN